MSYNLNKVNDIVSNLIATLIGHRGTANGFATLDENGRIPYSQLPESAMEYKGQWNAETNTPTLADGTGTKGDFYIVSVGGTQNLGSGNIQFSANDRIIYDGSVWARLSAGAVQTVNNISPENGNVTLTGENIPVSATNATLLSAPLTTERIADNAVTNAKIKDPVSVTKGGTGATDAKNGFQNLANGLTEGRGPLDTEHIIFQNESGKDWGLYTLFQFWEYIKSKISSVLGLTDTQYNGNSATATTADKTVNDITINIPYADNGQFVIPLGNILQPGSTEVESPYNWDITGFFSVIRPIGHAGLHISFEAGHGYSHGFTTYAYLDEESFTENGTMRASIKAFQYNGKWWMGLWLDADWQGYVSKMTITYSRGLPATPTCILYNSQSGVANEEIYNSIQDIPEWWWRIRTIHNPITFTRNITAPVIEATASSGMVHTCYSHHATNGKTVSIPGFTLTQGACIRVFFEDGNSVAYPTLNVNDTGAKEIRCVHGRLDTPIKNNSDISYKKGGGVYTWTTGIDVLDLYYDGSYWYVLGDPIVTSIYIDNQTPRKKVSITGVVQSGILY